MRFLAALSSSGCAQSRAATLHCNSWPAAASRRPLHFPLARPKSAILGRLGRVWVSTGLLDPWTPRTLSLALRFVAPIVLDIRPCFPVPSVQGPRRFPLHPLRYELALASIWWQANGALQLAGAAESRNGDVSITFTATPECGWRQEGEKGSNQEDNTRSRRRE